MVINAPRLTVIKTLPMQVRDPRHFVEPKSDVSVGQSVAELKQNIELTGITSKKSFQDTMLRALDGVSVDQHKASNMIQSAIVDPGSVDIHDVTIAQTKATMSLNITRTILSRLVQGWRDIVNTR